MNNECVDKYKKIKPKHTNYIFLITTLLMLFITAIGTVVVLEYNNINKIFIYLISPFIEIVGIFLPVIFYLLVKKADIKKILRLNPIKIEYIIPLIIIGIASQLVGLFLKNIVIYFLQFLGKVPAQEMTVPGSVIELIFSILFIATLPAVVEELFARGLIMRAYEGYSVKWGIIVSALFFGIMHYSIINFIFPVFLGLVLGYIVYRTNSIFAGMIVHFINNAFGMILLFIYKPTKMEYYQSIVVIELFFHFIIALVGLVLMAGALYYIFKTTTVNIQHIETEQTVDIQSPFKFSFLLPILISIAILITFFIETINNVMS